MNNIKGFAVATDGNMKRIAITYDVVDESGKVINPNVRVNRVVTDKDVLNGIAQIESYAQEIVDAE